jgi:glycosyltransferase involved in cell wall biosynthesis
VTIYDLRASRFETSEPELAYQRNVIASVRERDCVLTSSESTRRELCDLGVAAPERIFVVPLAADRKVFHPCHGRERDELRRRCQIPSGPYILMLRDAKPRKNIARAIEAFAALVQQEHLADLSLVLAGNQAERSDPVTAVLDRAPSIRHRIINVGYVPDEDLAALYRSALAFVYPSFYEGFGLPPLEAMQCGTVAITSNASSLPEVVGDAGIMVDPYDRDALASAMLTLYRSETLRECLRRRCLARAAQFSWERTLASTLDAYRAATRLW